MNALERLTWHAVNKSYPVPKLKHIEAAHLATPWRKAQQIAQKPYFWKMRREGCSSFTK